MSYDNEKHIVLFDNSATADGNKPTMTGFFELNGQKYRVALWPTRKDGCFNGKVEEHDPKYDKPAKEAGEDAFDDDIPF